MPHGGKRRQDYACDFGESYSDDIFEGFGMATCRCSTSFSLICSIHTSNVTDFSSDTEDEIQDGIAVSSILGFNVALAYDRNWLKFF